MFQNQPISHVAYADESHWNRGRFRGVGLVSTPLSELKKHEAKIGKLFDESGIQKEFKWEKVGSAKDRFAAIKLCKYALSAACAGLLRVDVLVWDTEDRRHKVQGRDDIANLQRMYYHLFRNVLRQRWPSDSVWAIYPDEHTGLDWENVQDFLDRTAHRTEMHHDIFAENRLMVRLQKEFQILRIFPTQSQDTPLIQMADLFCGLCIFSRQKYIGFMDWKNRHSPQAPLFEISEVQVKSSRIDKERFRVLEEFVSSCKKARLGVSLQSHARLRTLNPQNPINFWWYVPQHPEDRAPIRNNA